MKFKKQLSILLISTLLVLSSCSHISIPTNANTAFRNFTLNLFKQEVASNTINLHYSLQEPVKYGITASPITLGSFDFNEASSLANLENLEAALHKFPYDTLSEENQLTYDILNHYFTEQKKSISYYLYEEPLSPVTGIHAQLPVLLAEYQFNNKEDVNTYLSLLETLPDYFSSLVRFEQQKSACGLFMSDSVADAVIEQCNAFVSMGDENYLLSTFEERLKSVNGLSSKEQSQFIQRNKELLSSSILPAYTSLASSLASLKGSGKNTQGLCYFQDGTDYYTHLVSVETGSNRSVEELKDMIQSQINADLVTSQQVLDKNPAILEETTSVSENPETILQTLKSKICNAFPDSVAVNVEVKYVPDALEEYLSPAFYLIPAIDNYENNTIYINGAHSLTDISLFTTLAHEGYPGHLYQTTYFSNTNPDPIRNLLSFPGYVEGWATYAEMCSYYISPLEKDHATLLQKNNSIILGLYATADIGIHYDGWSLEEMSAFFSSYGIDDASVLQEIYEYIVGDPANYLTYYVGYLEMMGLKKEWDSSQKEFHQKVLEIGPAPFDIIRKHLLKGE